MVMERIVPCKERLVLQSRSIASLGARSLRGMSYVCIRALRMVRSRRAEALFNVASGHSERERRNRKSRQEMTGCEIVTTSY